MGIEEGTWNYCDIHHIEFDDYCPRCQEEAYALQKRIEDDEVDALRQIRLTQNDLEEIDRLANYEAQRDKWRNQS